MTELTRETMDALAEPFAASDVRWKPQAVAGDRALALPFADARTYMDRLDEVVGPDWSDEYEVHDGGAVVVCQLTIRGVTRSDVGEADPSDKNTSTSALSQSFKRACTRFGIGRFLYRLPEQWADYDPQRKVFTPSARRKLRASLEGGEVSAPHDADTPKRKPKDNGNGRGTAQHGEADATSYWSLYNEHARSVVGREKAKRWAESGDWSEAMRKLREALE